MQKLDITQRIQLRDEIFEEFKKLKIFRFSKEKYNIMNKSLVKEFQINFKLKEKYELYIKQFRSENEARYCLIHIDDFENHKCPICNNICKFYNIRHGYRNTCGNKECSKKLLEQTCLKIYGEINAAKNEKIKDKIKETNKRIYGYTCPLKNKYVRMIAIQTSMNHYNKPYPSQSEKVKELIYNTNLKNRGVKYVFQDKKVKELSKKTMIKDYGADHPMKCKKLN